MQPWARTAPYCSALQPFRIAKSGTSFGWRKCGNVTYAGWQVTLCDPISHASSHSGEAGLLTKGELLHRVHLLYFGKSAVRVKGTPYSIAERRVPELIPVLGSQPAGES